MKRRGKLIVAGLLIFLIAAPASAQHAGSGNTSERHRSQLYDIITYGAFRDLMLKGDFAPKVVIGSVMSRLPSTGVGAVSDARGEITIIDGKLIISYGKSVSDPASEVETAALLATGRAKAWQSVNVTSDIAPDAVEAFLAQAAKAHGLDPDNSFPFQLRGTVAPYAMHVNIAPIDGPHGMDLPMAITDAKKGDEIAGGVAGLYVSPALVGVVTHGGERIHAHWVSPDSQSTAHLDRWGIRAGSTLLLPKPE